MGSTVSFIGAKGGVGTSTVAALYALTTAESGNRVHISAIDSDGVGELAALLGVAWQPEEEPVVVASNLSLGLSPVDGALNVIDAGVARLDLDLATPTFLVVRNDFLGLRRALQHHARVDGVVMVNEPQRALGRRDIEDVLGRPVLAELPVAAETARVIDAGLLASRHPRLVLAIDAAGR